MERKGQLGLLILTLRGSVVEAITVLERYEGEERQQTFPRALERAFRAVEHDARTMGLLKLAEFAQTAKEVGGRPLNLWDRQRTPAVLRSVVQELTAVADDLEAGKRHRLDAKVAKALAAAHKKTNRDPDRLEPPPARRRT